jgi:predicted RNA-binding Zn ribbon-like protein
MVSRNDNDERPPAAPHSLDLVIDFVNTLDREAAEDELAGPEAASDWLKGHGLLTGRHRRLSEREQAEALDLREALRALMVAHTQEEPAGEDAAATLERVAKNGGLAVRFGAAGVPDLVPRSGGFAGALAALLVPVANASADGTWARVKACRADDCQWAFYDRSRNRSGTWCEMAVCGNREKVRSYRSRAHRHG